MTPRPAVGWVPPSDVAPSVIDIGSIIGRSFDTFGREWSLFLVLAVPGGLGMLFQRLLSGSLYSQPFTMRPSVDDLIPLLAGTLVGAAMSLFSTVAIAAAADSLWQGRPIGVVGAFAGGLRSLPRYLGVTIVVGLMFGGVALLVGGIIAVLVYVAGPVAALLAIPVVLIAFPALLFVTARLSLLLPVAVLERNGVLGSIERAWNLSRGHAILLFLLSIAIGICAALPVWGGTMVGSSVRDPAIAAIALGLATLVYLPLPVIATVLAWGDRIGGRFHDSGVMARGQGRTVAAALVFGLGGVLLVAGFGLTMQAASSGLFPIYAP